MPIKLETVSTLSTNDRNDLINIYEDYSPSIRPEGQWDPAQWIDKRLANKQTLFTGRFNGRLLTAIWANKASNQVQLEDIAVIAISRRRGVATQLLTLLTQQAKQGDYNLVIGHSEKLEPFTSLLKRLGFAYTHHENPDEKWIYYANNTSNKG